MVRSIGPLTIGEIAWIAGLTLVLPLSLWLLISVNNMPAQPTPIAAGGEPLEMYRLKDGWLVVQNDQRRMGFRQSSMAWIEYIAGSDNFDRPGRDSVMIGHVGGRGWRVDVDDADEAHELLEFILDQKVPGVRALNENR